MTCPKCIGFPLTVTSVIVGVKLNVSDTLNFEMRDDLAQLFLEAEYADKLDDG